eukprot:6319524-Pyramimonas_sp.AAC.1
MNSVRSGSVFYVLGFGPVRTRFPVLGSVRSLHAYGPHGYISTGVTVIRFATPNLAKLHCRYMSGLQ